MSSTVFTVPSPVQCVPYPIITRTVPDASTGTVLVRWGDRNDHILMIKSIAECELLTTVEYLRSCPAIH